MKRFLYIISALMVSVVAMGQTTQGLTGKYINFAGGLQASEAFKLPVYSTNPSQNGLGNQGRIWFDPVLNKFRGHDGTTVSSLCRENSVTLQMALNNGSVAITNQATLIEYQDGTDMANVYVGDGTVDLNANDAQFHMNGTGADINVPLSLLAPPTEPNHAARYGETIPLSGTVAGSPVRGDVEMTETAKGLFIKGATKGDYSSIYFGEDGICINSVTISDNTSVNIGYGSLEISSTLSKFQGATYDGDYSANFEDRSLVDKKFVIDYVAAHAGGGGGGTVTSVTGISGETTVANGTTTPVIGISSAYTAARDSYADSAAASAASGKQNTLVSGTNIKTVGGVTLLGSGDVSQVQNSLAASTTLAPSVTAVNNALLYFPRIIFASTTSYPGTGATSAILLKAVPISANDLSNGTIQTDLRARFTGNAGTKQILLYMNTSASLTGATLLASGLIYNSSITSGNLHRMFSLNGTTLRGYAPIVQNIYPTTPTQPDLNVTYNPANQYYIIAACINGNSADTTTLDMFNITFTKATDNETLHRIQHNNGNGAVRCRTLKRRRIR